MCFLASQAMGDIDFEPPTYSLSDLTDTDNVVSPLAGQDSWVSGGARNAVVATENSGLYVGGQAARNPDNGGSEEVGRLGPSPAVGNTMQADFFPGDTAFDLFDQQSDSDSVLILGGWIDTNNDGLYDHSSGGGERGFLFGMDNTGSGSFAIY